MFGKLYHRIKHIFYKQKHALPGGIYTADPYICPQARLIEKIGYEEMLELSSSSGRRAPINPRAVELAMINKVPILYTSIEYYPKGTIIAEEED